MNVIQRILLILCALGLAAPALSAEPEVDLRPRYFELGLYTKDQGRRPSCAVFAVLGALEFHYSLAEGKAALLSEEFLIGAARRINPDQEEFNGFSIGEVVAAIERYGVVRADAMPNNLGGPPGEWVMSPEVREEALGRRKVRIRRAAGSKGEKIEAILRELKNGYPVAISLAWPPEGVVARVHTLRDQPVQEGAGHAVTVVGYQPASNDPDERLFLFRNSYGIRWGIGGYGLVSEVFLRKHLWDVVTFRLPEG